MTNENSLNSTPRADRVHIGFYGMRNAGKSSIVNSVLGQQMSIVSDVLGTTTDPVLKAMELLPLGPVVIIDTPGLDDEGELGALRVKKSYQMLNKTDIAVLVIDAIQGMKPQDQKIIKRFVAKKIPYLIVMNKYDLMDDGQKKEIASLENNDDYKGHIIEASASTGYHINELKNAISTMIPSEDTKLKIVGDLIDPNDFIVLVVPIDKAAPKGRLILPQQQTIRDILEADATSIVVKENALKETLEQLGKKPKMVITDSQVFAKVAKDTPDDVLLTSFSILFARYKGNLETVVKGVRMLDQLNDGDIVLISEGCTHHRQCDDIGTVKLPRWVKEYTGKDFNFEYSSGTEFPEDLSKYKMIIHCGGCTLNEREMKYRLACAVDAGIPITNYGICIAYMKGILKRSVQVFPDIAKYL